MIKSDFYPDYNSYGTLTVTDDITSLNVTDKSTDPLRAYYMGTIRAASCPILTPKKFEIKKNIENPGDSEIIFKNSGTPIYWGYTYTGTSSGSNTAKTCYYNETNLKYVSTMQMLNSAYAYYINNYGALSLTFRYREYETQTVSATELTRLAAIKTVTASPPDMTCAEFIDWIENDTSLTVTFNIDGTPTDFDIKCSDFANDGFIQLDADKFITLEQCNSNGASYYFGSGSTSSRCIVPFFSVSLGNKYFASTGHRLSNDTLNMRIYFDYSGANMDVDNTEFLQSGTGYDDTHRGQVDDIAETLTPEFSVTWDDLRSCIDGSSTNVVLLGGSGNRIMMYSTTTTGSRRSVGIVRTYHPRDLYALFNLFNKYRSSGSDSSASGAENNSKYYYSSATVYSTVGLFYPDNSPKLKRANYPSDDDYTQFAKQLRDWQKYGANINSDEFSPDEPPGPEPRPEPDPPGEDEENSGDNITLPDIDGLGGSFGFTTQYAMRGSQLEELGSALWAGFDRNNPDVDAFIQNFVYNVDPDTGSVNMADIMTFFVSLRAYPIPLGNLTSIRAVGTDFYIGSGTAPLRMPDGTTPFTSNLHVADSYLESVNAGTVSIPFWFGDYRDYQTEITLYLPYCGTAELNPGDVMGGTLQCTYVVDLSTGSCTAYVMCNTWDGYTYPVAILPGQLGVDIPITASNAGRVGARLLGDRINVAENLMSVLKNTATGIGSVFSGNVGTGIRSGLSAFIDPALQAEKLNANMAERGAIAAPMLSGGRGLAGFKNPATAYIQVRSPFYAVPDNFADYVGDPAATRVQIRTCNGFCKFVGVDVSGITTDAADQAAIRQALENGIYV